MKNFSKTLTLEEATEMYKSDSGMQYVDTANNRKMMKQVLDNHLIELSRKIHYERPY